MFYKSTLFALHCLFSFLLLNVETAPRSRSKSSGQQSTTFDQKQTGEYNIQLHLKDFNVIAVVADEAFGDLGDYEYNYDYADLTIKPSSSTSKPSSTAVSSTSPNLSSPKTSTAILTTTTIPTSHLPTIRPENHHIPQKPVVNQIFVPTYNPAYNRSTAQSSLSTSSITPNLPPFTIPSTSPKSTTGKLDFTSQKWSSLLPSVTEQPLKQTSTILTTVKQEDESQSSSITHTETPKKTTENQDENLDKGQNSVIHVLQSNNESSGDEENPSIVLGEVMHYRKCSIGFARDKRGRCRRIRKPVPQLSFDITRLASGLAAKFRRQEGEAQQ